MVPGEHTVGQRQLTVQLWSVGKELGYEPDGDFYRES